MDENTPMIALCTRPSVAMARAIANVHAGATEIKVDKDNPMYRVKYATLRQIKETLLPLMKENNLMLSSKFTTRGGQWGVLTELFYMKDNADYVETMDAFFPIEKIADPQQLGKAMTYGRRYNVVALFDLTFLNDEDDDDGNSFVKKPTTPKTTPKPINL